MESYPARMPLLATSATFTGFADKSPAELREILLPEDRDRFDATYREALDEAARTLSLDTLEAFLVHWRRYTWSQHDMGPERWRAMLAKADYINRTGQVPPGTVTYSEEEMAELIRARLAAAR